MLPRSVDVLVVGAGQAGLGAAYRLTRQPGLTVQVVDRGPVGQSWLDRWDSLVLFTPRRFSSLPGLPFPRGSTRCPTRTEMAAYLREYARRFELPVRTGVAVRGLRRSGGRYVAETSTGMVEAEHVVVATGPFTRRHIPAAASDLSPDVHQLHSGDYRRPTDVPTADVLVVGGGNSAAQLAVELAATHTVTVAAPRPTWYLPESALGVDLYWWLLVTGVLNARSDSRSARYVQHRGDAIIGTQLRDHLRTGHIRMLTQRVVGAHGHAVRLADGSAVTTSAVLWCTGFRPDTHWIDVPGAIDATGAPIHTAGASPVPGLHWIGLPWQTRLNSSIIDGVDREARALTRRITRTRTRG